MTQVQALEHRQEGGLLSQKGIAATKEQLDLLTTLVQTVLKEGADYGLIPGTKTPTLFKPGADNVSAAFNVYPEPAVLQETVDPDKGYISYTIGVKLVSRMDGQIKSQGIGQCNSYEAKYRYRWEGHGEERKRVVNPDPLEQANTILKMAEKRAYVDAVMKLPGVARFFTQDQEDYPVAEGEKPRTTSEYGVCDKPGHERAAFFKTDKMRGPAHRTATGGWCDKPAEKPAAAVAEPATGQTAKAPATATPDDATRFFREARAKGLAPGAALAKLGNNLPDYNAWVRLGRTLDQALKRLEAAS